MTYIYMSEEGTSIHRTRMRWNADKDDVRAHTVELTGQPPAASSAAEFGGNPDKSDPGEMFVAALSSCHMPWLLALARAERVRPSDQRHRWSKLPPDISTSITPGTPLS